MRQVTACIIGAGPIGIELAVTFKKLGISYLQFDKGQIAQMIYNFPPQTYFFSSAEKIGIAAYPIQTVNQQKCTREEYLAYLRSVTMHYGLNINSYEEVVRITHHPGKSHPFHLMTQTHLGHNNEYSCRYLVIASGGTSYPRLLHVKGEELPHVTTKMLDPHHYFQKKVVIIGAKNSAVESALRCYHAGANVTLVIRKEGLDPDEVKYWLLPEITGLHTKGQITLYGQSDIVEITRSHVILKQKKQNIKLPVETDFIIKAIGFEADMGLLEQLHVPLHGELKRPCYDANTMETPVKDVFVLGTIVGGTQKKYHVFIENCHEHVGKIARAICVRENISYQPISGSHFTACTTSLEE